MKEDQQPGLQRTWLVKCRKVAVSIIRTLMKPSQTGNVLNGAELRCSGVMHQLHEQLRQQCWRRPGLRCRWFLAKVQYLSEIPLSSISCLCTLYVSC